MNTRKHLLWLAAGIFLLMFHRPSQAMAQTFLGVERITFTDSVNGNQDAVEMYAATNPADTAGFLIVRPAKNNKAGSLLVQPKGIMPSGGCMTVAVYGQGGYAAPPASNVSVAYCNGSNPYYILGTSNGGGAYAPLYFWNFNHTAMKFERVNGLPVITVNDPITLNDDNALLENPTRRLTLARQLRTTPTQNGHSWPLVMQAHVWDNAYGGQEPTPREMQWRLVGLGDGSKTYYMQLLDDNDTPVMQVGSGWVKVNFGTGLKLVQVGAIDSGGPGKRTLVIDN